MIHEKTTKRIIEFLAVIIPALEKMRRGDAKWAGRKGAAFCLAHARTGIPFLGPILVGRVNSPAKADKYLALCREKALRLAENPGHYSNWQSRDPDADMWGGAVRVGDIILSMSGLPELGDEALMLTVANIFLPYQRESANILDLIALWSDNPYWDVLRLLEAKGF
ncbi:MAG: hypothetical protein V1856_03125 [Candidatus Liptonbacteria bacterium]